MILNAALAIRIIKLRISTHISHERYSKAHHYAENRLKLGDKIGEIFQNLEQNIEHAAMLHPHDETFWCPCDAAKSPAMLCDAFSNMLVILLPILEYLVNI